MSRQYMLRYAGYGAVGLVLLSLALFSFSAPARAETDNADENAMTTQERADRRAIKKEFVDARRAFNAENDAATRADFEAAREEFGPVLAELRAEYKAAREAFVAEVRKLAPDRVKLVRLAKEWKEKRAERFTDRCHALTSNDQPESGFGAAWNPLSKSREVLIRAHCDPLSDDVAVDVGTGSSTQYVYQFGHLWEGDHWEKVELTSDGEKIGPWFVGDATLDVSFDKGDLEDGQYVVTYMCQWTGSTWKCGCSDEQCAVPRWNLQKLHRMDNPDEPDALDDEDEEEMEDSEDDEEEDE